MNFNNILTDIAYFEDKGNTAGEFTFGFEFEGYIDRDNFNEFDEFASSFWVDKVGTYGKMTDDGSIDPPDDEKDQECQICGGRGTVYNECNMCQGSGVGWECLKCNGRGYIKVHCPNCDGQGKNLFEKTCSTCHGRGFYNKHCDECGGSGGLDTEKFNALSKERKKEYIDEWLRDDPSNYRARQGYPDAHMCPECHGYGEVDNDCDECGGRGYGDNKTTKYSTFEFNSPVLKVTPEHLQHSIMFLKKSLKMGCQTNSSCGFHVHIGFPDKYTSSYDIGWVILQLVAQKQLHRMTRFKGFAFERYWANEHRFHNISSHLDNLKDLLQEGEPLSKAIVALRNDFTNNKQDIVSQHPQGTIEWRGPTRFMDSGELSNVTDFFKHLYKIVSWLSDLCNTQTLDLGDGVSIRKPDFVKVLSKHVRSGNIDIAHKPNRKKENDERFMSSQDMEEVGRAYKEIKWLNKVSLRQTILEQRAMGESKYWEFRTGIFTAHDDTRLDCKNVEFHGVKIIKAFIKDCKDMDGCELRYCNILNSTVCTRSYKTAFEDCALGGRYHMTADHDECKFTNCRVSSDDGFISLHNPIIISGDFKEIKIMIKDESFSINSGNFNGCTFMLVDNISYEMFNKISDNCQFTNCIFKYVYSSNDHTECKSLQEMKSYLKSKGVK